MELYEYIIVVALVFSRISAMFSIIPIFGARNTPMMTKIGLILFLSLVTIPTQIADSTFDLTTFSEVGTALLTEAIIGFSLGFVVLIMMNVFYLAGSLVDRNIGFSMVSVLSAQDESQLPVTANVYYIFAMMLFLIGNVHHMLIRAVLASFTAMPLGSNPLVRLITYEYTEILTYTFDLGFRMAAPFILTVLIANILLGLLSKAMPGMNVFIIGMPLKILVGLFLLAVVIRFYPTFIYGIFEVMLEYIYRLMG